MDLAGRVGEVVLALELGADRLLQLRDAIGGRVFGLAIANRLDGGVLDIVRRVKVRLARAKTNHVMSGPFQLIGLGGDGDGGRWLYAVEGIGEVEGVGHEVFP